MFIAQRQTMSGGAGDSSALADTVLASSDLLLTDDGSEWTVQKSSPLKVGFQSRTAGISGWLWQK